VFDPFCKENLRIMRKHPVMKKHLKKCDLFLVIKGFSYKNIGKKGEFEASKEGEERIKSPVKRIRNFGNEG
jgi:hypothetical protein